LIFYGNKSEVLAGKLLSEKSDAARVIKLDSKEQFSLDSPSIVLLDSEEHLQVMMTIFQLELFKEMAS
jgi:hypothetical protein